MIESLSTIFALTKVASLRAVGLCCDEIAVNTKMLQDIEPRRKTLAILKVMCGSLAIKMLLIPVALVVNTFVPGVIVPLLMVGGLHVSCEGLRHLRGEYESHDGDEAHKQKGAKEFERERIKKVLTIDGLLSVEITVMTLGVIVGMPVALAAAVLVGTGLIRTFWMYTLIGGVISIPRAGEWLARREGSGGFAKAAHGLGRAMVKSMPYIVKGFSVAGTVALLMIGGGLLLHGIPGAEHAVAGALGSVTSNVLILGVLSRVAGTVAGLASGFAGRPVEDAVGSAIGKGFSAAKKLVTGIFRKKPVVSGPDDATPVLVALPQPDEAGENALKNVSGVKDALNAAAQPPPAVKDDSQKTSGPALPKKIL